MALANRFAFLIIWWCLVCAFAFLLIVAVGRLYSVACALLCSNGRARLFEKRYPVLRHQYRHVTLEDLQSVCERNLVDLLVYLMLASEIQSTLQMSHVIYYIKDKYERKGSEEASS